MPADQLIEIIKELLSVHKDLNHLAEKKTNHLKNVDVESLQSLLNEEKTAVSKLEQLENKRMRDVQQFLSEKGAPAIDLTVTELLKYMDSQDQLEMLQLQHSLLKEMTTLRHRNALNQELIKQSLQFINVSLNLFDPREETANYGPQMRAPVRTGRSLFDSKA